MDQQEIFEILGIATKKSVDAINDWDKAILKIKRREGNVGFESFYTKRNQDEIPIDTEANYQTSKAVHALHKFMSETFGSNNKWNRMTFTLFPDNKINTKYIWDQQLQDEVNKYNS